jgi:hypothetical protein
MEDWMDGTDSQAPQLKNAVIQSYGYSSFLQMQRFHGLAAQWLTDKRFPL